MKKQLLIGLGIFLAIILAVFVVYTVKKPSTAIPTPKPTPAPLESPVSAPVLQVQPAVAACTTSFVVACGSGTPTPSPSASVSPSPSASTSTSASLECVVKRMYVDDSRNRAGFYYTEDEIEDTNTIENGQTIVYNVVARNTGGTSVSDTTITDVLSSNLSYVDGDSGCSYNSTNRTVTCVIGAIAPGSEAQRSFRAKVSVSGTTSVANTAEVSSTNGQRDSCSIAIDATGKVIPPPSSAPSALPEAGILEVTTGTLGAGLILLLLGGLGLLLL